MFIVLKAMKAGKVAGPSEVCAESISSSEKVEISVMLKLCQRVLDRKEIQDEKQTSVLVPIFKGKRDVISCNAYRGVKLLRAFFSRNYGCARFGKTLDIPAKANGA